MRYAIARSRSRSDSNTAVGSMWSVCRRYGSDHAGGSIGGFMTRGDRRVGEKAACTDPVPGDECAIKAGNGNARPSGHAPGCCDRLAVGHGHASQES